MLEIKPFISVVVAAYNEENVITANIHRIVIELSKRPEVEWELVCVDDGSIDNTGQSMDFLASGDPHIHVLHHRRNFGQGRALRTGFDICRGEIIVTLDADLSYGPENIYRLVDKLITTGADIILASPYMKGGSVKNVPLYRHFLSRFGNFYLSKMLNGTVSTSTCVVRAYRREVFDTLLLTSDGMELQIEILAKASIMGFQVLELPAHLEWDNKKASQASLGRVSKMRIARSIRTYLLLGWLSRPAILFAAFSLVLIIPGGYMAAFLAIRTLIFIQASFDQGFLFAISSGLEQVFRNYTYSVIFSSGFLLVGLQIMLSSLLSLQNQMNFEELYRVFLASTGRHTAIQPKDIQRYDTHFDSTD